jgi:hypothetical protein
MKLLLLLLLLWAPSVLLASSACPWLTDTLAPNYRDLIKRHPARASLVQREAVRNLLRLKRSQCGTPQGESLAAEIYRLAVEAHSGKVGLIFPLSGKSGERGRAHLKGIEAALGNIGTRLIVKDSGSSPFGAERALAELVFRENVALVVAAGTRGDLDRVIPWADGLLVPMLVLSSEAQVGASRFAFRVFPSEQRLGAALATAAAQRGWKRIAALRPTDGRGDRLLRSFLAGAKERGLEVKVTQPYQPNESGSLDSAVRQIFRIDPRERAQELGQLQREAEKKAKDRGLAFDPRTVILKPIVEVDAILLPDHFRTLRHLTKILAYHGAGRVPLLGPQSWRTSALVDPPEPQLTGSLFVDFMGSYDALPEPLRVPGDGFFAEPSKAAEADFTSIGLRAGRLTEAAMASGENRRNLPYVLQSLANVDSGLFGPGPAFDSTHESRWPLFVFTIKGEKLDVAPLIQ